MGRRAVSHQDFGLVTTRHFSFFTCLFLKLILFFAALGLRCSVREAPSIAVSEGLLFLWHVVAFLVGGAWALGPRAQ